MAKGKRKAEEDHDELQPRKAMKTCATATENTSSPTLLSLPAELRAEILRYGLHSRRKIRVHASLRQPALLQTCRLLRQESLPVWYTENRFCIDVIHCDSKLLQRFVAHEDRLNLDGEINLIIGCDGLCNWANLMEWCKAVSEDRAFSIREHGEEGQVQAIVVGAHNILDQFEDRSWEECERALQSFGSTLRKLDLPFMMFS